jgi:hypothetical protein
VIWLEIRKTWDGLPALPNEQARVGLAWQGSDLRLQVEGQAHGDTPPACVPGPTPGLWDHEVIELFLCGPGQRYLEVEIGPAGHHLVLLLDGFRRPVAQALPLQITTQRHGDRWCARAILPASWLPPQPWTANAYAMHGTGPDRRYLACHPVPGDGPDFHRLNHFRPLELEAP